MEIIHAPIARSGNGAVLLPVDRHTLAKRRWRGTAEDGREFGFDLAEPLCDADRFFQADGKSYAIAQQPEPVLELSLDSPAAAARLGWLVGNLHFSLEIDGSILRVADDPALRQMLAREHLPFSEASRVFHPFRPGHAH